ncbi:CMP152.5L [Camelpox virus CMS]|uniref:CMP152.5L n=1 Tax=Camelpox virus (strain CMS) TaxID=203172 RepID=Q8QQ25_CAMPS|nr:CMP152.5L [Camelpox virus CMS]
MIRGTSIISDCSIYVLLVQYLLFYYLLYNFYDKKLLLHFPSIMIHPLPSDMQNEELNDNFIFRLSEGLMIR